jgi:hypothetical protein
VLAWDASTDDSGSVNYAVFFDDNPTPFLTSGDTRRQHPANGPPAISTW